ncbi:MAG: hypothetical protein ACHP7D_08655 [Lysobacterales bacterium]
MHVRQILGFILLIAPMGAPTRARADDGQAVHRCVGRHGEIVFSGLACAATDAASGSTAAADATTAPLSTTACPASFDELRGRLAAALTRHDANALANLLRWRGVGAGAATERLRVLRDLVKRPLLSIDGGDATDDAATIAGPATASGSLRVRTGSNESSGMREYTFATGLDSGCYWLMW